jgi:hypothetical protein
MASAIEKDALQSDDKNTNPSPTDTISVKDGTITTDAPGLVLTHDEYHLATLGYKQEFTRSLGLFESLASTFTSMNFISGIPVLFGWVMYTGGPKAAFANWTMVGGFSCIVSLVMAELGAALPTTGGIYFWSYRLGGEKYGPFLSWMTAWWNVSPCWPSPIAARDLCLLALSTYYVLRQSC